MKIFLDISPRRIHHKNALVKLKLRWDSADSFLEGERSNMRKALTFVLVALLLMSTFMVASCSKGGSSSSSGSQAKTPAKEKVKIQIMVGFGTGTDPSQIAVHEELQAEFNNTVGKM